MQIIKILADAGHVADTQACAQCSNDYFTKNCSRYVSNYIVHIHKICHPTVVYMYSNNTRHKCHEHRMVVFLYT